ncbi:olfactory receptor 4A15-like [Parambassis ranga]|uniref:Olfactory receptor n=1 Tax=Parambassis ranga TaxID=210632 RepID=A0A6P7HP07_9TELE|nr:olfactory receptor 4A15-like [Parambassis ranga]
MDVDGKFNVTHITLDGFVELSRYRYLYFIITFTSYILIMCFNSSIVCIIVVHKNLHEPMYVFIAALLINSILFSTLIYPQILIDLLSEKQIISYTACLFQWFVGYSSTGSEFCLLAAMAYDRYVSICKPLHYANIMTKTTVSVFLLSAWILPACHSVIPVVLSANMKLCMFVYEGIICSSTVYKLHCVSSRLLHLYGVVAVINVVVLPVVFILFTYTRIFVITFKSCREVRRKAAQTCLPHLLVLISFSCLCMFEVLLARLDDSFPKTVRLIIALQIILYHPLFNPIIYGLKMKEIHKHLRSLFIKTL